MKKITAVIALSLSTAASADFMAYPTPNPNGQLYIDFGSVHVSGTMRTWEAKFDRNNPTMLAGHSVMSLWAHYLTDCGKEPGAPMTFQRLHTILYHEPGFEMPVYVDLTHDKAVPITSNLIGTDAEWLYKASHIICSTK